MEEQKQDMLVKKVLTTEVKYIIGIAAFICGVVAPYYSIKQDIALQQKDIALIRENHLKHIETIEGNIQKIQEEQKDLRETSVELMTIISERLPKK